MFTEGVSWEHRGSEAKFPHQLYGHALTACHVLQAPSPDDDWDHGSHEYELVSLSFSLTAPGEPIGIEFEPRPGQEVYAVVLSYGDGDTFGHTDGLHVLMGVFDDANVADALVHQLQNPPAPRPRKRPKGNGASLEVYRVEFKGREYTRHWVGYFSNFNSLDVRPLVLDSL